jgi:DNA-binding SARP family transcriptional activator
MLGGFRVSVGYHLIEESEWRLKKAASLVKLLSLAPQHRLHREQLMELLWPDLAPKAASNNLRYALYHARRILGAALAITSCYLYLQEGLLVLCPEGQLWVDVEAFEDAAVEARRVVRGGSGVVRWGSLAGGSLRGLGGRPAGRTAGDLPGPAHRTG